MIESLIFQGALANVSNELNSDDLLKFLDDRINDAEFYKFQPEVGKIYNSALDWTMIVSTSASIITIAGALWDAYKHFVQPIHKKGNKSAFLFITMKNKDGNFTQFSIGNQYENKEIFVRDFIKKTEELKIKLNKEEISIEKKSIIDSKKWIKIRTEK